MIKASDPKREKRTAVQILEHAEGFIGGFESDQDQIGIPGLIMDLRELIAELKAPQIVAANPRRVYIDVSGGNVQEVVGTNDYEIIDWDNIEQDPTVFWQACDEESREYIKKRYPHEYEKFFVTVEERIKAAAPDLLSAAERVENAIESLNRNVTMAMGPQLKAAVDDLTAAIAKAKGQT